MKNLEYKEKKGIKLSIAHRKELLIALSRKRDWKSKRARESFHRPAFYGTELEPGKRKGN